MTAAPSDDAADDAADAGVQLAVTGAVATVTLSRPGTRNAQTPRMWAALARIGTTLPPSVRIVVVRADGPSFSAGLDLGMLSPQGIPGDTSFADLVSLDDRALEATIATYQEAFCWLRRPSLVTIAAVQGNAIGAGFQLALACDLRVLADDARLAMRETSLGLVPDLGGTSPLVQLVGYARALEICLTGRDVGSREAVDVGLATVAVPRAELDATVDDLVAALLTAPAGAVTATKALLLGAVHREYDDQLAAERRAQVHRLRELQSQRAPADRTAAVTDEV